MDARDNHSKLRAEAEARLKNRLSKIPLQEDGTDIHRLVYELHVHQIELEMQNDELRRARVELEESLNRYVDFYDFSPVGYITLNDNGTISEVNLTGAALLGVERKNLLHRRFDHFVSTENFDNWNRHFRSVLTHEGTLTCELELLRSDGSSFFAQMDCFHLKKAVGKEVVRIVLTDITQRKLAEEDLRTQKEFFHMIAENVEDFIAVLDLEGRRLYNNPSYARLFGDVEALKGTDSFSEIHPDDRERIRQTFKETIELGIGMRTEFRFLLPNGDMRYMESCGGLINDSEGKPFRVVVVSRDITDRKLDEIEIQNLAFYDSLTQLPNRRLLVDRLEKAIAASKRNGRFCAVMFIDLDNFKLLNDMHGHKAGDLLLVEVAQRLERCVREVDTVARFGGDEFVVVLSKLGVDKNKCATQANIVAEKIRSALAEPYKLNYISEDSSKCLVHHSSASIGVVLFSSPATQENILKWADKAMYQAKQSGRNRICFYDSESWMAGSR